MISGKYIFPVAPMKCTKLMPDASAISVKTGIRLSGEVWTGVESAEIAASAAPSRRQPAGKNGKPVKTRDNAKEGAMVERHWGSFLMLVWHQYREFGRSIQPAADSKEASIQGGFQATRRKRVVRTRAAKAPRV